MFENVWPIGSNKKNWSAHQETVSSESSQCNKNRRELQYIIPASRNIVHSIYKIGLHIRYSVAAFAHASVNTTEL
jgi:hypothetical protein